MPELPNRDRPYCRELTPFSSLEMGQVGSTAAEKYDDAYPSFKGFAAMVQEQARLKNHPNVLAATQPSSLKPKGREHRQRLPETDADPTRRVLKTGLDGKTTQRRSSSLETRSTVIITSEKDTF